MDIKQKITENKKIIGACCGLIILLSIIGALTSPDSNNTQISTNTDTNLFNNSTTIKTSEWDYTPDGFKMVGKDIYGSCRGTTSDGVTHDYFFTGEQMAALGNISDYSFSFNNLHVIADNSSGHYIVTHIFYQNGTEVGMDWSEFDFMAYAKVAGAGNPNCVSGFGYSTSELNRAD
ncbi:hypothetical protein PXD04_10060 [Methanosphaera sp. ISO3-F5]|uniref:hypothetical protein n=1 Tax=Methanosphaera sp. ISO3-F5 TaxID=1452353 RepID=UPI002B2615E8|nr:hypothetical protein [Methanosphaera sp. ISO3-F5]WQH64033.1 hypothetical protein PXD04_10060 [Methanosphaera sp. ISO3-F5]